MFSERDSVTLQESNNVELQQQNGVLSDQVDNSSNGFCLFKFFSRKKCAICCGLLYYFLLGVEETIMSAYFSVVAKKRGLNTFQIGLAYTMMEISNFAFSFVVMYAIKPRTEKLFFVAGSFDLLVYGFLITICF